jgi:hypothetical protein
MTMNGEEGTALLRKLGLLEVAIDYATESGAFVQAFELAKAGAKQKLPDVSVVWWLDSAVLFVCVCCPQYAERGGCLGWFFEPFQVKIEQALHFMSRRCTLCAGAVLYEQTLHFMSRLCTL